MPPWHSLAEWEYRVAVKRSHHCGIVVRVWVSAQLWDSLASSGWVTNSQPSLAYLTSHFCLKAMEEENQSCFHTYRIMHFPSTFIPLAMEFQAMVRWALWFIVGAVPSWMSNEWSGSNIWILFSSHCQPIPTHLQIGSIWHQGKSSLYNFHSAFPDDWSLWSPSMASGKHGLPFQFGAIFWPC